jgi:hypothetical protein
MGALKTLHGVYLSKTEGFRVTLTPWSAMLGTLDLRMTFVDRKCQL